MIPNKPRFVDLGDEVGELLLEGERRDGDFEVGDICLIDTAMVCNTGTGFNLLSDIA